MNSYPITTQLELDLKALLSDTDSTTSEKLDQMSQAFIRVTNQLEDKVRILSRSSPVEWCNRFVSFGLGYALSWSGVSSCWVGCGVSRDLVRMSRLR